MQNTINWYAFRSIRRTIPMTVVLPMLLGILLTGYITYRNIQLAIEDLSSQLRAEVSAVVSNGVDRFLQVPQQAIEANSRAVARDVVPAMDVLDSPWRDHLLAQMESFQDVQFMAYRTLAGELIQVSRVSDDKVWLVANTPGGLSYNRQLIDLGTWNTLEDSTTEFPEATIPDWYSKAMLTPGHAVWTADFEHFGRTRGGITLSQQVVHAGKAAGVMAAQVSFNDIDKLIQRLESASGATTYFLRDDGQFEAFDVLAASAGDKVFGDERGALTGDHDEGNSLLEISLPHIQAHGLAPGDLEAGASHTFSFVMEQEIFDVEISPLSVDLDPPWYSVVVNPRSDFTSRIHSNTRSTILLVLAGFLLATWLGMRMARRIVEPVLGLRNAALKIRTQTFDPTEVLRIARRTDEFGELARTFTDMAEVVAAREKDLEEMVEKRTEQVREQARKIAQQNEENEQLLLNILPLPTARRLQQGEKEISDAYDCATVLFSDFAGFTELSSQMRSTDLLIMLNKIFTEFDHLCLDYGVEKIKTIGDGYMAAAGLPDVRDDHAEVVIALAIAMQEELEKFNESHNLSLQLRIGVNSGPVTAGVIGTHKFIYDLWGDTVNTASRMESTGRTDQIQVSKATRELAKDTYCFDARGEIAVKGKGKMRTYWVTGVQEGAVLPSRASEPKRSPYSLTGGAKLRAAVDSTNAWGEILSSDVSMRSIRALLSKDLFGGTSRRAGAREPQVVTHEDVGQDISWRDLMQQDVTSTSLKMLLRKDLLGDVRKKKQTSAAVAAADALLEKPDTNPVSSEPPADDVTKTDGDANQRLE